MYNSKLRMHDLYISISAVTFTKYISYEGQKTRVHMLAHEYTYKISIPNPTEINVRDP